MEFGEKGKWKLWEGVKSCGFVRAVGVSQLRPVRRMGVGLDTFFGTDILSHSANGRDKKNLGFGKAARPWTLTRAALLISLRHFHEANIPALEN